MSLTLLTYCHATDMARCKTCQHSETFADLAQLPDALRRPLQREALMVNSFHCQMTSGGLFVPAAAVAA